MNTPKLGEISLCLTELDDRYVFSDSDPAGMRLHIPKAATLAEIRTAIREALLHNDGWITDVLTRNLPDVAIDRDALEDGEPT
jgi:hypothetical protein